MPNIVNAELVSYIQDGLEWEQVENKFGRNRDRFFRIMEGIPDWSGLTDEEMNEVLTHCELINEQMWGEYGGMTDEDRLNYVNLILPFYVSSPDYDKAKRLTHIQGKSSYTFTRHENDLGLKESRYEEIEDIIFNLCGQNCKLVELMGPGGFLETMVPKHKEWQGQAVSLGDGRSWFERENDEKHRIELISEKSNLIQTEAWEQIDSQANFVVVKPNGGWGLLPESEEFIASFFSQVVSKLADGGNSFIGIILGQNQFERIASRLIDKCKCKIEVEYLERYGSLRITKLN